MQYNENLHFGQNKREDSVFRKGHNVVQWTNFGFQDTFLR